MFCGDEYLFYLVFFLDVVIVCGIYVDEDGNFMIDEEVMKLEVLYVVFVVRCFGVKVLVQVKYCVVKGLLYLKSIIVFGNLIDVIVVCEELQMDYCQILSWVFDLVLCGDIQLFVVQNVLLLLDLCKFIGWIVCCYLIFGCVINFGIGIFNDVIGVIIYEEQFGEQVIIIVELGIYGGQQVGGVDFGIGCNLSVMISYQD